MHVTDHRAEFEVIPLTDSLLLCRGGQTRPRLAESPAFWAGAKPLPERRVGERRETLRGESGRRRADTTTLAQDLELAVLDRKLRERRQAVRRRA